MDVIQHPADKLMRVMMFIVVKQCISFADRFDILFVVKYTFVLFVQIKCLEKCTNLNKHVYLIRRRLLSC